MRNRHALSALFLSAALLAPAISAPAGPATAGAEVFVVDRFSSPSAPGDVPEGWRPLEFPGIDEHTRYSVEGASGGFRLRADSSASASALYRRLDLDPLEYPILAWRWRVEGVIEKGDARTREGDDYAARVYVLFEYEPEKTGYLDRIKYRLAEAIYGIEPPGLAIDYIWANRLEKGAAIANAYTERVMMVAVESGAGHAGEWRSEERNVYDDYKRLFGAEPPRIKGIAVMADSDNTKESAVSYYDDIIFKKAR